MRAAFAGAVTERVTSFASTATAVFRDAADTVLTEAGTVPAWTAGDSGGTALECCTAADAVDAANTNGSAQTIRKLKTRPPGR